jgi:hypothetical protein
MRRRRAAQRSQLPRPAVQPPRCRRAGRYRRPARPAARVILSYSAATKYPATSRSSTQPTSGRKSGIMSRGEMM